jgi:MoaA/NifB/PqqE/SkfB family radical SAM enzyme
LAFGLLDRINLKALENLQSIGVPNLIRHLGGWSPFPVGVVLVLAARCNLKCDMCLQAEEWNKGVPELTLAELKGVVDDLSTSFRFKPLIHLTGGEPLLRRDLLAPDEGGGLPLLAHIKARGFRCSLTTNGLLLERHAGELVRLGLDRLHVSLDGPAEIHDAVRGVRGAHDRAVAGVRAVAGARKASGVSKPFTTINTVISQANLSRLGAMIAIGQEAGADALSYQHLMFSGCINQDQVPLDIDRLLAEIPRLKRQARASGLAVTFYPRMGPEALRTYYQGGEEELNPRCVFPWYVVRVDTLGNITPCHGFVVDNVKAKAGSFRQVWNSRRFRAFRKELAAMGVFDDCGRCCHRQY